MVTSGSQASCASERIRELCERAKARYDDTGYQENASKLRAASQEQERDQRRYTREHALRLAHVPEATWSNLDVPDPTEAIIAVREFLAGAQVAKDGQRPRFLILAGPKGRGKTMALAHGVGRVGGRYITTQEVVTAGSFDRELLRELEDATLLAIDEMGSEKGNDASDAVLYELLDKRYRRKRLTIIATNLDASAFMARYCRGGLERLQDRLATGGIWMSLPGPSLRGLVATSEADDGRS